MPEDRRNGRGEWHTYVRVYLYPDAVGAAGPGYPSTTEEGGKGIPAATRPVDCQRAGSERPHNRYYAPKCFAQEAAARAAKLSQAKFEAAMNRLFATGVIRIENYGRVNRPDRRIVRAA